MALFRKSIEIRSRLRTPLKGDTIWGHVACGVASHEGDEGLEKFFLLDPPFVVSSAFPHGYLPKPVILEEEESKEFSSMEEYTEFKKRKKCKFVPASEYLEVDDGNADSDNLFVSTSTTHVTISRETGAALDEHLFVVDENWPDKDGLVMDLYIASNLPAERIDELVSWAFEFGYGADISVGAGEVRVLEGLAEVRPAKSRTGRYIALGPFVVKDADISDLRGSTFIRKGKIGGALASEISPYKKSVILFDEGATFRSEKIIDYVGTLLHQMHSTTQYDICQSAFAPVIEV